MQPVGTTVRGGEAIESWITHCPTCEHPVWVPAGSRAVACPQCNAAFAPEGLDTAPEGSTPSRAASEDPLIGSSLGPWRIVRLIGRGGMGRVYEATNSDGNRRVAVKVLSSELALDPAFVKRFHREARVLSSLEHPHVVEVLDQGEHDGELWFAMEYVRGENLRRRIHSGPLPPEEAVRIAREVASALAYAHGRGVVHRDLKPENVLLDEQGRVHLVDFGLSRLPGDGGPDATTLLTKTDVILGTYEYMAPEQRRGQKDLDGRADVYALGVMLYEMLTGALPLGHFEPPSHVRRDVPEALDGVVNRALATDRGKRYPSADALRDSMEDAWAQGRTRKRKTARRKLAKKADTVSLTEAEVEGLRPILRHVDIMVALDRVLGVVMLLAFVGLIGGRTLDSLFWLRPVGLLLLIAAILLLRQGGKLSRMSPGAREGQVLASVLMLLLPPLGTLMGLYGLRVFTGEAARQAFLVGRKALEGPRPIVEQRIVEVPRVAPRKGAPVWLHLLVFGALLWTVYSAFVLATTSVDGVTLDQAWRSMVDVRQNAVVVSVIGSGLALTAVVTTFLTRRRRRGVGMALTAFLLFGGCTWFLSGLPEVRRARREAWLRPAPVRLADPFPSLPRLEYRR